MQIHDFNINALKSFFKKINKKWFAIALIVSAIFIAFIFFYYYSNTLARNSGNIENLKNNSETQQTTSVKDSGTANTVSDPKNNQLMSDINSELSGGKTDKSASAVPSANSGTGWSAVLKMALGLAVVVVMIYLTVFLLKFINKNRTAEGLKFKKGSSLIKIIDSINIAPNKSVTLVSVAGKMLILGVTDKGINFLSEIAPGKTKNVEEFLSDYSEFGSGKTNFKDLLANYFKK